MTTHTLFALDSIGSGTGRKVEIDGLEILLVRIDDDLPLEGSRSRGAWHPEAVGVAAHDAPQCCADHRVECGRSLHAGVASAPAASRRVASSVRFHAERSESSPPSEHFVSIQSKRRVLEKAR